MTERNGTEERSSGTGGCGLGHGTTWELLPWYVNGTLEGGELRGVEAHLEACGICRREVAGLRGVSTLLREEATEEPAATAGFERLRARRAVRSAPDPVPGADAPADGTERARPGRGEPSGWFGRLRRTGRDVRRALGRALGASPAGVRWTLGGQLAAIAVLLLAVGLLWTGDRPDPGTEPEPGLAGVETPAGEAGRFRTLTSPAGRDLSAPGRSGPAPRVRVVFSDDTREREIRGTLISVGGRIVDGPSPTGVYTIELAAGESAEAVADNLRALPRVEFAEPGRLR